MISYGTSLALVMACDVTTGAETVFRVSLEEASAFARGSSFNTLYIVEFPIRRIMEVWIRWNVSFATGISR